MLISEKVLVGSAKIIEDKLSSGFSRRATSTWNTRIYFFSFWSTFSLVFVVFAFFF